MKKLLICLVFALVSTTFLLANTTSELTEQKLQTQQEGEMLRDCFAYAIAQLESFEARHFEAGDALATEILNDAYARCWLDEHPEYQN